MPWKTVDNWMPGGKLSYEYRESQPVIRRDDAHYATAPSHFVEINLNAPIVHCRRVLDFSRALDRWFQSRRSA